MPTLKQLTCQIEFGEKNIKLTEYGTQYNDGVVSTHVAVPSKLQPFNIHLTSSGYISTGLAMFVFIDGKAQCNRNRQGLVMPDKKTDKSLYEIDFRVRQKEEKVDGKHFLGREWTFQDLQTVPATAGQNLGLSDDIISGIGAIEVVVLRCHGETSKNVPRAESAIDDGRFFSLDGAADLSDNPDEPPRHVHPTEYYAHAGWYPPYDPYLAHRYHPVRPEYGPEYYTGPRHPGYPPPTDPYFHPWPPRNYYDQAPRSYRRPAVAPRDKRGWPDLRKKSNNDSKEGKSPWDNNNDDADGSNDGDGNDDANEWENTNDNNNDNQNNQDTWGNNNNDNENEDKPNDWGNDNQDNNDNNQSGWDNNDSNNIQDNKGADNWEAQNNSGGGWDNNDTSVKNESKKERKKIKKQHEPPQGTTGAMGNQQDPSKPYVKSYWARWHGRAPRDMQLDTKGRRDPYIAPAEPQLMVPEPLAEDRKLSHLVQAGKGKMYQHYTATPKYMDTMENPYAVFVFHYRSQEALEKMFPDLTIKEDREAFRDRIREVPRDDLVEMLIKAKKHAGYTTDSSMSSSSSSDSGTSKRGRAKGSKKSDKAKGQKRPEEKWSGGGGEWGNDVGGGEAQVSTW